ncbi:MAG TPA: hypothetical protein V6D05_10570 [Stenomitos sp.]
MIVTPLVGAVGTLPAINTLKGKASPVGVRKLAPPQRQLHG